jgi:hypothetical protein
MISTNYWWSEPDISTLSNEEKTELDGRVSEIHAARLQGKRELILELSSRKKLKITIHPLSNSGLDNSI